MHCRDPPVTVSAEVLADYVGKYDFGMSSSSRDKRSAANSYAGIGADIELAEGGARVRHPFENSPVAGAGLKVGDLITDIDDVPVKGLMINQVMGKLRGVVNSRVRFKIARNGQDNPIEIAVTRAAIYVPAVELQVRIDGGKLVVETTGPWPVLDFEKGKPVAMPAMSDNEFYVDSGDHTRISFTRDAAGKVSGAVLNPGPWEQKGVLIGKRPS